MALPAVGYNEYRSYYSIPLILNVFIVQCDQEGHTHKMDQGACACNIYQALSPPRFKGPVYEDSCAYTITQHIVSPLAHKGIHDSCLSCVSAGSCCIADLSMAVKDDCNLSSQLRGRPHLTDARYLAPEFLEGYDVETLDFTALKKADMYSFALVLWEIARRCWIQGVSGVLSIMVIGTNCREEAPSQLMPAFVKVQFQINVEKAMCYNAWLSLALSPGQPFSAYKLKNGLGARLVVI